ncbi:MAG: hypothetical protein ACN4GG_06490 [Akkermansiaceae bacterium]
MKLKTVAVLGFGAIFSLFGIHSLMAEKLVKEDGKVSAKKLTLDEEVSKQKFESATFGLG